MKSRKYILNLIIILIVTTLTVVFLISKNLLTLETIKTLSITNVLSVFVVYLFSVLLYSLVNYLTVRQSLPNYKFYVAFSDIVFGRLGSDITPLKSGHFPLRLYYLSKLGYSFYDGLLSVTKTQIVASFSSVINYAVLFVVLFFSKTVITVNSYEVSLYLVVGVGLFFHIGSLLLVMALAFIKSFQSFCINFVARLRFRKRELEREEFTKNQILKYSIYKEQIKLMLKDFLRYILPCFLYVLYMYIFSSAIYVSYLLTSSSPFDLSSFISFYLLTLAISYISNVIPIPGGNGSSEALFVVVFPILISSQSLLGSTLLLWRLSTYYLPVVFGLFVFFAWIPLYKRTGNKKALQKID